MIPEKGLGHPLLPLALAFFRFFLGRLMRMLPCGPSGSVGASGASPSLPLLPKDGRPPLPPGAASDSSDIKICGGSVPLPPSSRISASSRILIGGGRCLAASSSWFPGPAEVPLHPRVASSGMLPSGGDGVLLLASLPDLPPCGLGLGTSRIVRFLAASTLRFPRPSVSLLSLPTSLRPSVASFRSGLALGKILSQRLTSHSSCALLFISLGLTKNMLLRNL